MDVFLFENEIVKTLKKQLDVYTINQFCADYCSWILINMHLTL